MKMKKIKKLWLELKSQVRPYDFVVVILLIAASFIPATIFAVTQNTENAEQNQKVAVITIDGKEVDRFTLSPDTPHQEKTYHPSDKQYNIVEIDGDKIRVRKDNSPDQIAVRTGWISKPGQTSICLPHRLVIEIKNTKPNPEDEMIISY